MPYEDIPGMENVSPTFLTQTEAMARRLGTSPEHLLRVMSFETAGTFDPAVKNRAGSGATGLIQFMPATARRFGTSSDALARMTPEEQLPYVERYFRPYRGKLGSLQDTYAAVLYPKAVGKPAWYGLFMKGQKGYEQNAGLDADQKGRITIGDAAAAVGRFVQRTVTPASAEAAEPVTMDELRQALGRPAAGASGLEPGAVTLDELRQSLGASPRPEVSTPAPALAPVRMGEARAAQQVLQEPAVDRGFALDPQSRRDLRMLQGGTRPPLEMTVLPSPGQQLQDLATTEGVLPAVGGTIGGIAGGPWGAAAGAAAGEAARQMLAGEEPQLGRVVLAGGLQLVFPGVAKAVQFQRAIASIPGVGPTLTRLGRTALGMDVIIDDLLPIPRLVSLLGAVASRPGVQRMLERALQSTGGKLTQEVAESVLTWAGMAGTAETKAYKQKYGAGEKPPVPAQAP